MTIPITKLPLVIVLALLSMSLSTVQVSAREQTLDEDRSQHLIDDRSGGDRHLFKGHQDIDPPPLYPNGSLATAYTHGESDVIPIPVHVAVRLQNATDDELMQLELREYGPWLIKHINTRILTRSLYGFSYILLRDRLSYFGYPIPKKWLSELLRSKYPDYVIRSYDCYASLYDNGCVLYWITWNEHEFDYTEKMLEAFNSTEYVLETGRGIFDDDDIRVRQVPRNEFEGTMTTAELFVSVIRTPLVTVTLCLCIFGAIIFFLLVIYVTDELAAPESTPTPTTKTAKTGVATRVGTRNRRKKIQ